MDSQVGVILRRARNRRNVELSEVEAATRIRLRYLRAIESEDWDVLPGGVYTRGFIRTYAGFLGLDGERLVAEYRAEVEGLPGEAGSAAPARDPAASVPPGSSPRGRMVPSLGWLAVAAVVLVAAAAIVLFPDEGGDGSAQRPARQSAENRGGHHDEAPVPRAPRAGVSVQLAASAEVWVCVLDARGRHLVNGQILETGAEEGPFRSGSFTVAFGNGEVSMLIDGRKADIPATSSPIGYSIDANGALTELDEAERPTCI